MPSATLKRKRDDNDDSSRSSDSNSGDEATIRARFQKAFEAKFRPLEIERPSPRVEQTEQDQNGEVESDDSEWSGFEDDEGVVETVDLGRKNLDLDERDARGEKKAFMSSKPPSSSTSTTQTKPLASNPAETAEEASTNLKNDLALQRLLKESHLLSPTTFSSTSSTTPSTSTATGKSRLKALDIRLATLGAKSASSDSQVKMPLAHRKGIVAKGAGREEKRRREAKESGVVLERFKAEGRGGKERGRERGVDGPGVGRFRGGTLRLSEREVRGIQGRERGGGRRGRGRGR